MSEDVRQAAIALGARRADIPGLWFAPGYPELTEGQLVQAAAYERSRSDIGPYAIARTLLT
jgi:hypothetical protein